jgi:hypothetical protein
LGGGAGGGLNFKNKKSGNKKEEHITCQNENILNNRYKYKKSINTPKSYVNISSVIHV